MTRQEYIDAVKVKIEEISPFDEPDAFIDGDPTSPVKPVISYINKSLDEAAHNCLKSLPLSLLHKDLEQAATSDMTDDMGMLFMNIKPNWRLVRFHHNLLKRDITSFITTEDPLYLLQQNKYTCGGREKPVAVVASTINSSTVRCNLEVYTGMPNTSLQTALLWYINTAKHADNKTSYIVFEGVMYYYGGAYGGGLKAQWTSDYGRTIYTDFNATGDNRTVYKVEFGYHEIGTTEKFVQGISDDVEYVKSPIHEYIVLECAAMVAEILGDANTAQVCRNQYQTKLQAELK